MVTAGLLLLFAGLAALELPALWRRRLYGEAAAWLALMLLAAALSFPQVWKWPLPRHTKWFELLFWPLVYKE